MWENCGDKIRHWRIYVLLLVNKTETSWYFPTRDIRFFVENCSQWILVFNSFVNIVFKKNYEQFAVSEADSYTKGMM